MFKQTAPAQGVYKSFYPVLTEEPSSVLLHIFLFKRDEDMIIPKQCRSVLVINEDVKYTNTDHMHLLTQEQQSYFADANGFLSTRITESPRRNIFEM